METIKENRSGLSLGDELAMERRDDAFFRHTALRRSDPAVLGSAAPASDRYFTSFNPVSLAANVTEIKSAY